MHVLRPPLSLMWLRLESPPEDRGLMRANDEPGLAGFYFLFFTPAPSENANMAP